MANEYTLSYTAREIDEKLGKIDTLAEKEAIPTTTSELENDSGFITADGASEAVANDIELPQGWVDINNAYVAFGEPDHTLLGGVVYKDFEGNIKVFPLARPYGIRTEECGAKESSIAVYNSAQQLMVKPATDGRHTVSLRQLDEFFGGGLTSDLGSEKTYSLRKLPPVDTTDPVKDNRHPYVFCRDTDNIFGRKFYNEAALPDNLVERDPYGRALVKSPDASSTIWDDHVVNVGYLNRRLSDFQPGQSGVNTAQVKEIMENILLEGKW